MGDGLPYGQGEAMVAEYSKSTLDFRMVTQVDNQNTQAIAASSTIPLTLTGMQGMFAGGFIIIRTGSTGAALRTYTSLAGGYFDIADASDRTLLGSVKYASFNSTFDWQRMFGNTIGNNQSIYVVSHAQSLQAFVQQGVMTGFNVYDGNNKIKLTTDGTWTPGTYTVTYLAKMYSVLRIINGRIDAVYKS
jgi:hypothetical protein